MRSISTLRTLLFGLVLLGLSAAAHAQFGISVSFAPPELPVYEQPLCPGEGYMWTPGYWAYADDSYYWIPGAWVMAPEVGFLWTPGYWGWGSGGYSFNEGYWGPHIGFYGGINYGYGYSGRGYEGGRWDHDQFFYNRSVNNVNVTNIHNVYNTTVSTTTVSRVSFNGGQGGISERARPEEEVAAHERHLPPVAIQTQHQEAARANPSQRVPANRGQPAAPARQENVAAGRPGGATPRPENTTSRPENYVPRPTTAVHPNDLPARERPAPPNTGNPNTDRKYQQGQDKLAAKQDQERQKLQQRQDQEHQQLTRQNAPAARTQQVEQQHQQQTQNMAQKHSAQQQRMQVKQQPRQQPGRSQHPT